MGKEAKQVFSHLNIDFNGNIEFYFNNRSDDEMITLDKVTDYTGIEKVKELNSLKEFLNRNPETKVHYIFTDVVTMEPKVLNWLRKRVKIDFFEFYFWDLNIIAEPEKDMLKIEIYDFKTGINKQLTIIKNDFRRKPDKKEKEALHYFYNSSYIGIISNVLDNKFRAGIIETTWKLIERKW